MAACLPEQLWCSGEARAPDRISSRGVAASVGSCVPQPSASAERPARCSMAATSIVCRLVPVWEAQAMAISASPKPKRSAAPVSRNGKACSGLMAERGKTGRADIAEAGDDLAVGAHDGDGAGVRALDEAPARELDEDWIVHLAGRLNQGAR